MSASFWIRRFVSALVIACALLFLVQLAKGDARADAIHFAALWGAISAGLFTSIGYLRYRRNPDCMLPRSGKQ